MLARFGSKHDAPEQWGFNLHSATRVHGNDKQGREHLCRYILRPPFANHRLHTLPDGKVHLDFKRPGLCV